MNQEIKKCSKCQEIKIIDEFHKDKSRISGYRDRCKHCCNVISKKHYISNKINKLEYQKQYQINNHISYKLYQKQYQINNKEYLNEISKINYLLHQPEKCLYQKNRYYNNKSQIIKQNIIRNRKRRTIDINFRLLHNLRRRINNAVKGIDKSQKTLSLLGCTIDELRSHLESKFAVDMTWNNYGKWHIDHIIPCSIYELRNPVEQKQCFHYTNLQPLWATDNLKKSNKIIRPILAWG